MARTGAGTFTKTSLNFLVLSLFVRHVSSQACAAPYPQTCTCTGNLFSCTSANLTDIPSDLPNGETLLSIDLSNNTIRAVDSDVLSAYTQLQTLTLVGNGLTGIVAQSLTANFQNIDLSSNPIACDSSLTWLTAVTNVLGTCASGQELAAFIEGLKPTPSVPASGPTKQKPPSTDAQSQPMTDAQSQPMTDAQSQPMTTASVANTTPKPAPNRFYVLAIILPVLVIVVVVIAIVVFSIKRNRKQQEAYNSTIRYSVVRKDAGAPGNRVYSDVTTEL